MADFYSELFSYSDMLKKKIIAARTFLNEAPDGYLSCNLKDGKVRYYLKENAPNTSSKTSSYLSSKNTELIHNLAQKRYYQQLLPIMEKEEIMLNRLVEELKENKKEKCYSDAKDSRKCLINPEFRMPEDNVKDWLNIETNKKEMSPDVKTVTTRNGETVRSKSEKIIADELLFRDIPYRYEAELRLGGKTIYPDFTVLNKRTGKEYYLEHLGMMDNTDYYNGVLRRLDLYSQNGIYIGDKLLLTYESSHYPVNSTQLNHLIEEYLI